MQIWNISLEIDIFGQRDIMWVQLASMKPQLGNIFNYPVDDFFTSMKIWELVKYDIALDKLSVKEFEYPFRDSGK